MQMKNFYHRLTLFAFCLLGAVPLRAQTYPLSDKDLATKIAAKEQITDVPTIYLTIPDVSDLDKDLTKDRSTNTAAYHKATIQVVDKNKKLEEFTETSLQIKVRGNSTADPSKKPYRLKFGKDEKDAAGNVTTSHKHDLLGYGYKKRNWVLMANQYDKSMIRNALTYHLGKYVGMDFCPGYCFVDLVINDQYRGTYQVTDHVEAGTNRVDIDEDNDWMLEFVSWSTMLDQDYGMNTTEGVPYMTNIKNPEPTGDALTQLKSDIATWETAWNKSFQSTDKRTGWQAYNDVESFIKFYIAINLTSDWDGFFVMKGWRKPDGVFHFGPLWDKDLAYGNYADDNKLVDAYENGQFHWNFVNILQKDVNFLTKAKELMDKLNNENIATKLVADVESIAKAIENTRKQNYAKWNITDDRGVAKLSYTDYDSYINQLKEWIPTRVAFVKKSIDDLYNAQVNNKQTLTYSPAATYGTTGYYGLYSLTNKLCDITISPANTVNSTEWSTLILPFDATQAQMETALGGQYDLCEFSAIDGNTFKFVSTTTKDINASTPYLIKMTTGSANASWTFSNVVVTASSDNPITLETNGTNKLMAAFHLQSLNYQGTNFILKDGSLVKPTAPSWATGSSDGANNWNGLQLYVEVSSGTTPTIEITTTKEDPTPTDPNEHKRQTTLPTIYINGTLSGTSDDWQTVTTEVFDDDASALGGSKTYEGMEAKYKGTYKEGEKHGYRLKFKKKQKLQGYRQWELLPLDNDPTLLREALALETGKQLGMHWTPNYQFVDLCLSTATTDAYTYAGTYLLVERVKAEDGRALITGGNDASDWLIELTDEVSADDAAASVAATATCPNIVVKNPDPDDYAGQEATLTAPVKTWAETTFKNTGTLASALNKEQFIEWYIAQEVLCAYKGLSDVYAYRSVTATDQTLYFGPLADNGRAFGNYKKDKKKQKLDMSDKDKAGSYDGLMVEYADYAVMRHLLKNLWLTDWFASGVQSRWSNVSSSLKTALTNKVASLASAIQASREKNYSAETGGAGWKLAPLSTDYQASVDSITTYLTTRFDYLDAKFKALAQSKTLVYNTSKDDAMDTWLLSDGQSVKVQLKKRGTINGGEWNMLTLPFSLNSSEIDTYFGNGTQVERFTSATETGNVVTLHFTDCKSSGIEAGKPYIVKPASDVAEKSLVFSDRTFSTTESDLTVESGGYKHIGTLNSTTLPSDGTALVLLRGNSLKRYTGTTALNGCRAYFLVPTNSNAKTFRFMDETTGIELLRTETDSTGADRVFNLSGQQVSTSLDQLPSGIYIVGGKKMVK